MAAVPFDMKACCEMRSVAPGALAAMFAKMSASLLISPPSQRRNGMVGHAWSVVVVLDVVGVMVVDDGVVDRFPALDPARRVG
jgi:hypothetical protein